MNMSREIKFRAFTQRGMGEPFWPLDNGFLGEGGTFPEGTIFMQYTGLKDKNGKEIYEGDICLKFWDSSVFGDRPPIAGVIKWVDFGGRYTHESNGLKGHKYYHELHENLVYPEYPRSLFEVIGNIHQNAELLNSES